MDDAAGSGSGAGAGGAGAGAGRVPRVPVVVVVVVLPLQGKSTLLLLVFKCIYACIQADRYGGGGGSGFYR
ncbi:hypothetical protein M0804_009845 [Polistes exclamans]|nr:hypothetical protein M0804_009845 [Polistes exclamans]